jgi:hypothetical protein
VPIRNAGRPRTIQMLTPAARYSTRDITDRASDAAAARRLPHGIARADPILACKTRHNSRAANGAARRLPCRQEVGVC